MYFIDCELCHARVYALVLFRNIFIRSEHLASPCWAARLRNAYVCKFGRPEAVCRDAPTCEARVTGRTELPNVRCTTQPQGWIGRGEIGELTSAFAPRQRPSGFTCQPRPRQGPPIPPLPWARVMRMAVAARGGRPESVQPSRACTPLLVVVCQGGRLGLAAGAGRRRGACLCRSATSRRCASRSGVSS